MNILKLINNDAVEENVLKIIEHIKKIETAHGLTEDKIIHKYTHGYCSSLVEIVEHFLPNVRPVCFWSCEEFAHFCIEIKGSNNSNNYDDLSYYDINGKKSYNEMLEWMANEFNGKIEGIFVQEMRRVNRSNEIQDEVYSTICIENENVQIL